VALAVAFSHPSLPLGRVEINDGSIELNFSDDTESTTFSTLGGPSNLWLFFQADDGSGTGEQILFNNVVVGGPIDGNLGTAASLFNIPVTAVGGLNTVDVVSPNDYFGWHVAVLHSSGTIIECLAITSQEVVCHADGTTFTVNVEGLNACTGSTTMVTFTGSGGAFGEEACFTVLVNDGGFCCSTEICVTVPDCSPPALPACPWDCGDGDGEVTAIDFFALLAEWGMFGTPCDFLLGPAGVDVTEFFDLIAHWGPCP
jgi:hypothetical protein